MVFDLSKSGKFNGKSQDFVRGDLLLDDAPERDICADPRGYDIRVFSSYGFDTVCECACRDSDIFNASICCGVNLLDCGVDAGDAGSFIGAAECVVYDL